MTCAFGKRSIIDFGLGQSIGFSVHSGQGFVVSGFVEDIQACSSNLTSVYCGPMQFTGSYDYDSLSGFSLKTEKLTESTKCGVNVTYEISVD